MVQSPSFAELWEQAIRKYRHRALETAWANEALIDRAKEMRAAELHDEALRLSQEELAFYDAMEANESSLKVLGTPTPIETARHLVAKVKKTVAIGWTLCENERTRLRVIVRRILRNRGYLPDKKETANQTVLEQAEVLSEFWPPALGPAGMIRPDAV